MRRERRFKKREGITTRKRGRAAGKRGKRRIFFRERRRRRGGLGGDLSIWGGGRHRIFIYDGKALKLSQQEEKGDATGIGKVG